MMHSSITSKGQVTIPKNIRDFLKVRTSDKIIFTPVEDGKVLITTKQIPGAALFGMFKHRSLARPVSLEEMDSAIRKKRTERMPK